MTAPAPDALYVQDLQLTYGNGPGSVRSLDGATLSVPAATFVAVMGPSGSGKSSLLSCAAGLIRPDSGRVVVDGVDVTDWDEDRRTEFRRERIGIVFQDFHLMPYLTAAQNVALPDVLAGRATDKSRVHELLTRFGLADRAKQLPPTMSGGQQQRVAIARALLGRPGIVLADEPTGALDSKTARSVLGMLRAAVDAPLDGSPTTVLMVTHDPVAASFADRVVFLVDGRVADHLDAPSVDSIAARMADLDRAAIRGEMAS